MERKTTMSTMKLFNTGPIVLIFKSQTMAARFQYITIAVGSAALKSERKNSNTTPQQNNRNPDIVVLITDV